MPQSYGPSWGPAGRRHAAANPHLRVGDAERSAAADRLSTHFEAGRLDQAEFGERLERAMAATTQADLSELFDDLPPLRAGREGSPPRNRHVLPRFIVLVFLVAVSATLWHAVAHLFFPPFFLPVPWLLIGLLVFLWLRHGGRRRRGGQGPL